MESGWQWDQQPQVATLEGHFLPQTMTGRAWAPTLPTSSQLRGLWPASLAPSQDSEETEKAQT